MRALRARAPVLDGRFVRGAASLRDAPGISPYCDLCRRPSRRIRRIISSIRRECLDHVVVFNERHLRRLLSSYVDYYHRTRTHLALAKEVTPRGFPKVFEAALTNGSGVSHSSSGHAARSNIQAGTSSQRSARERSRVQRKTTPTALSIVP